MSQISVYIEVAVGLARVSVEDNGHGIEPSQQNNLFDAFFTTKTDGMGMGLAISRSIVEAHDGTLGIDLKRNSGAKFTMALPAVS